MKQQLMTIDATKKLVTKFLFFHYLIKLAFACCNPKKSWKRIISEFCCPPHPIPQETYMT